MDAIAYQMSFDEGQLALLCANYDRRIDSLGAENKQLQAENAKLRELVRDMAAEMRGLGVDFARVGWCDYADRMCELGVDE